MKEFCYKYPRPAVTTDCVVFGIEGNNINVLLIKRGNEPFKGLWALPGGFLNPDETAEEGALRELREETGLGDAEVEQLYTFSDPKRDPRDRVISIAYMAIVKQQEVKGGDDASEARWFPIDKLPVLAFDHDRILQKGLERLSLNLRK